MCEDVQQCIILVLIIGCAASGLSATFKLPVKIVFFFFYYELIANTIYQKKKKNER